MHNSLDGRVVPTLNGWKQFDNGGKGSGNFGHSGRPGQVGGSGDGDESDPEIEAAKEMAKTQLEMVEKARKAGSIDDKKAKEMKADIERRARRNITIRQVKPGDTLEITPSDRTPNFDKRITVTSVGEDYFRYGESTASDGKEYPWWAIKDLKILRKKK